MSLDYYNSRWGPSLTAAIILLSLIAYDLMELFVFSRLDDAISVRGYGSSQGLLPFLFALLGLSVLGILITAIWNFIRGRMVNGAVNFAMFLVIVVASIISYFFLWETGLKANRDAWNIDMPPNMKVEEPLVKADMSSLAPLKVGNAEIYLVSLDNWCGIYEVFAYANPGKQGDVKLEIYEATTNTYLNRERLSSAATESPPWSDDAKQQFLYHNERIVVSGGYCAGHFPVRVELWSGDKRKLTEKIFKVAGNRR